jgi:hypothetical protein
MCVENTRVETKEETSFWLQKSTLKSMCFYTAKMSESNNVLFPQLKSTQRSVLRNNGSKKFQYKITAKKRKKHHFVLIL